MTEATWAGKAPQIVVGIARLSKSSPQTVAMAPSPMMVIASPNFEPDRAWSVMPGGKPPWARPIVSAVEPECNLSSMGP